MPSKLTAGGPSAHVKGDITNPEGSSVSRLGVSFEIGGIPSLEPNHVVLEVVDLEGNYRPVPLSGKGTLRVEGAYPALGAKESTALFRVAMGAGAPSGVAVVTASLHELSSDGAVVGTVDTAAGRVLVRPAANPVVRLAGVDRFTTATEVSRRNVPAGSAAGAVLARGDDFADALAATPLARQVGGPVLLTGRGSLDVRVLAELQRILRPDGVVHLVGGESALSASVERDVRSAGLAVVRHQGQDRYETAVAIAESLSVRNMVFLTTGTRFPDALAAGATAASQGGVVLLTADEVMPRATAAWLAGRAGMRQVAVGGPAAAAAPAAEKVVGTNRYETAALLAAKFFALPADVGIASGESGADALSGGADIATRRGPIVLTESGDLPEASRAYMRDRATSITTAWVYGGEKAVAEEAVESVRVAIS